MIKQSTFLRRVLFALEDKGWAITAVDQGGDEVEKVVRVKDAMPLIKDVESGHIFLHNAKENKDGWIFFVWQGPDATYPEGEEIVSDYTINLDPTIENLYTWTEQ